MPASLGFMVEKMFGIIGSQSLLHLGTLSVQLSESSLVLIAACSVMSNCLLYLVVVSIVVVSYLVYSGPWVMGRSRLYTEWHGHEVQSVVR